MKHQRRGPRHSRQMILLGSLLVHHCGRGGGLDEALARRGWLFRALDRYLTRDADRKLFGLAPYQRDLYDDSVPRDG